MTELKREELLEDVRKATSDAAKIAAREALAEHEAEQKAKAEAEQKAAEEQTALREEIRAEVTEELNAERDKAAEAWKNRRGSFSVPKVTDLGSGEGLESDEVKSFLHYIRRGDEVAYRAAMQEGTDSEGGYTVPTALHNEIVAKLDEMAFARSMGAQIFRANSDTYRVPVEAGEASFAIVAEEGAANESEPTIDAVDITAYLYSNIMKVSMQLLEDEQSNLMSYLTRRVAEKKSLIENNHVATGNGTTQPQGVFVGGTAGLTSDSANTITAAEVPELLFTLESQYANSPNLSWLGAQSVYAHIMGKAGSDFQFLGDGVAPIPTSGARPRYSLLNIPFFTNGSCAAISTTNKTLAIVDWSFYGIFDRDGRLSMRRLNELYAANHQVGIQSWFRFGGAVLQAEAIQYLTQA